MSGILYVVATPIGNLGDITVRALEKLKTVNFIMSEDTRVTARLLARYEIKKPLVPYFQHTKEDKALKLIERIKEGEDAALVTDAGTPGISDPGGALISLAYENNIEVYPIPGPSALTAAISILDFPIQNFVFYGFLPHKKGRKTILSKLANENKTIILYESPYRIKKLLQELFENLGDRNVFIARELTKKFEETYRGKISEVINKVKEKGEFVVIIKGENEG